MVNRYSPSVIRLRSLMLRNGRRSAVLALLGFVVAAVLLAHGAAGMGHDSMESDQGMAAAVSMCLGIVQLAGGAVLLGIAVLRFSHHRRRTIDRSRRRPAPMLGRTMTPCSARAGPAALQVFLL